MGQLGVKANCSNLLLLTSDALCHLHCNAIISTCVSTHWETYFHAWIHFWQHSLPGCHHSMPTLELLVPCHFLYQLHSNIRQAEHTTWVARLIDGLLKSFQYT